MQFKTHFYSRLATSVLGGLLALSPTAEACEDTARARILLPKSLGKLNVQLTSKNVVINGVTYFISAKPTPQNEWCVQGTSPTEVNCNLPKLLFVSKAGVSPTPSPEALAALVIKRFSNGDPLMEVHEVTKPLTKDGVRSFSKGAIKVRIYGREMENGEGQKTWSMTVDAAKFDPEYGTGDEAENISEDIEIRHEATPEYARARAHPTLSQPITLSLSWSKDWNLNCVDGLFSYEDDTGPGLARATLGSLIKLGRAAKPEGKL